MTRRRPGQCEEGFLQRLHRRKLAVRRGEEPVEEPPVPVETRTVVEPEVTTESPADVLTDEDMPPVESLDADSDFSGFLSPGISEDLQRAALRRLWQVADMDFVDDLDIYASDYREFEPLGELVTREMRHRLELEAIRQSETVLLDEEFEALNELPQEPENPLALEEKYSLAGPSDTRSAEFLPPKTEKPA